MQFGLTLGSGGRIGARPSFSPLSVEGLFLWLDAAGISSLVQIGGAVSQWSDKSGNANHAIQSSAGLQPVTGMQTQNGLNVLSCDGTNVLSTTVGNFDGLSNGGETALYVVFMSTSASSTQRLFIERGPTRYGLILMSGKVVARHHTTTSNQAATGAYATNVAHIACMTRSGASVSARLNEGIKANATATDFSIPNEVEAMGRGNSSGQDLYGWIGEIVLFDRVLPEEEDAQVMTYLKEKWGIV